MTGSNKTVRGLTDWRVVFCSQKERSYTRTSSVTNEFILLSEKDKRKSVLACVTERSLIPYVFGQMRRRQTHKVCCFSGEKSSDPARS